MASGRQVHDFKIFCTICKTHIKISAPSKKDADKKFRASGHENTKVRMLKRGPVGYYKSEAHLRDEHEKAEKAGAAKAMEGVIHGA